MELNKTKWTKNDIQEFQQYLKMYENKAKREWATNLLRTELPVLCLDTPTIKNTVNGILKGNYLSFLDLMIWEYYENTAINGMIICSIKEFEKVKKYLDIYSEKCDNWATCDLLSFNVKGNEKQYFDITLEYIKSEKPFKRRIGLNILFNFINNNDYIDKIYDIFDKFENEEHYYVNMMIAWLVSECFIKQREKTLKYFENNKLSKFSINKAVQKCRESRRVSKEDKDMLLKFKVK